jgi:hypothetical protein
MRLLLLATICYLLEGCASYTVASIGSLAVTGKGLTDHAASKLSSGDCDIIRAVKNLNYYCQMPVVYNQNEF